MVCYLLTKREIITVEFNRLKFHRVSRMISQSAKTNKVTTWPFICMKYIRINLELLCQMQELFLTMLVLIISGLLMDPSDYVMSGNSTTIATTMA